MLRFGRRYPGVHEAGRDSDFGKTESLLDDQTGGPTTARAGETGSCMECGRRRVGF